MNGSYKHNVEQKKTRKRNIYSQCNKARKRNYMHTVGKGVIKLLNADDLIEFLYKLLEITSEFSKVIGYKVSKQK